MSHRARARLAGAVLLALAAFAAPRLVVAQSVGYSSPKGHVEVMGLRTWTLKMLRDSLQKHSPGTTLEDAACMAVLRRQLHFADALVQWTYYSDGPSKPEQRQLTIKLVEPADAHRVKWRAASDDIYQMPRPAYAELLAPIIDSAGGLWIGRLQYPLQFYLSDSTQRARLLGSTRRDERDDAARLWAYLDAHRSADDWHRALGALRSDGLYANRMVAAVTLINFADRDSTWWALVEALRDPHESVRSIAQTVLQQLAVRPVDWIPAAPSLRALLGGTNVGVTQTLMTILGRTEISPTLARPLLGRGNGGWVMAHVRAGTPFDPPAARALLVQLHGGPDLGPADAWARWLATL
jgi:hypothetical protein